MNRLNLGHTWQIISIHKIHWERVTSIHEHIRDICDVFSFYYTECEISSANVGRYYTGQPLTAQLRQRAVKRRLNAAE